MSDIQTLYTCTEVWVAKTIYLISCSLFLEYFKICCFECKDECLWSEPVLFEIYATF